MTAAWHCSRHSGQAGEAGAGQSSAPALTSCIPASAQRANWQPLALMRGISPETEGFTLLSVHPWHRRESLKGEGISIPSLAGFGLSRTQWGKLGSSSGKAGIELGVPTSLQILG